ncbi:hypothetical protein ANN_05908 [Periplaneta americana]|uniref:Mutator-like transposase domain-containing protein n=1 Tax=Periplaneta americana TaxID=6978 RepID=A0ABQ8TC40_PERAM|nr:hypothetical protein ANN_05908 [Periplaneta americana]
MQQSNICEDNMLKSGYVLVDVELLSEALSQQTKCKYCECDSLSIEEDMKKRKGLATSLVIVCAVCGKEGTFQTSKVTPSGYEVNKDSYMGYAVLENVTLLVDYCVP